MKTSEPLFPAPHSLKFMRIAGSFAICHLAPGYPVPTWALQGSFFSLTSTADEVSAVCPTPQVPLDVQHEAGWSCFKLIGPFPFDATGILASFLQPLAKGAIPIFAVSTFDTDYVLVKDGWVGETLRVLREAGHELVES